MLRKNEEKMHSFDFLNCFIENKYYSRVTKSRHVHLRSYIKAFVRKKVLVVTVRP